MHGQRDIKKKEYLQFSYCNKTALQNSQAGRLLSPNKW